MRAIACDRVGRSVGMCQVTIAGFAAAAAAQVCSWLFRTLPMCSPPRIHVALVTY